MDVNVLETINGAHTAFTYMRKADRPDAAPSRIRLDHYGQSDIATYSAAKFAVCNLTEALKLEWAEHGFAVLDLCPPFVNDGMVKGVRIGAIQSFGVWLNETSCRRD